MPQKLKRKPGGHDREESRARWTSSTFASTLPALLCSGTVRLMKMLFRRGSHQLVEALTGDKTIDLIQWVDEHPEEQLVQIREEVLYPLVTTAVLMQQEKFDVTGGTVGRDQKVSETIAVL